MAALQLGGLFTSAAPMKYSLRLPTAVRSLVVLLEARKHTNLSKKRGKVSLEAINKGKTENLDNKLVKIIPDAKLWQLVSVTAWGASISALICWNHSSLIGSSWSAAISI